MIELKLYFYYNDDFKFIVPYNPKKSMTTIEYDPANKYHYSTSPIDIRYQQVHFDCYDAFRLKDLICWRILQPYAKIHTLWMPFSQPIEYKNMVDYFSELIIQKYYKNDNSEKLREKIEYGREIDTYLWEMQLYFEDSFKPHFPKLLENMKAVYDDIIVGYEIIEDAEFKSDEKTIFEKQLIYTGMAALDYKNGDYYDSWKELALSHLISLSQEAKKENYENEKWHRAYLEQKIFHPFTKPREVKLIKAENTLRYRRKSQIYRHAILYRTHGRDLNRYSFPESEQEFNWMYNIFTETYKDKIVCLTQGLEVSDEGLIVDLL